MKGYFRKRSQSRAFCLVERNMSYHDRKRSQ
jgi:hypothetical protein